MKKEANIGPWLARFSRNFGSVSGETAPAHFRRIGGPVTGSLVQGAMLAAPAYGFRRLSGWLAGEDSEESRRHSRRMAALGFGGGVALNSPQFIQNLFDKNKGVNWNIGRLPEEL